MKKEDYKRQLVIANSLYELGLLPAQTKAANYYFEGSKVEKNPEKAAYWSEKLAEQGVVDAQYNMGRIYLSGNGKEADDEKAAYWFKQAAEQGDSSQNAQGKAYGDQAA